MVEALTLSNNGSETIPPGLDAKTKYASKAFEKAAEFMQQHGIKLTGLVLLIGEILVLEGCTPGGEQVELIIYATDQINGNPSTVHNIAVISTVNSTGISKQGSAGPEQYIVRVYHAGNTLGNYPNATVKVNAGNEKTEIRADAGSGGPVNGIEKVDHKWRLQKTEIFSTPTGMTFSFADNKLSAVAEFLLENGNLTTTISDHSGQNSGPIAFAYDPQTQQLIYDPDTTINPTQLESLRMRLPDAVMTNLTTQLPRTAEKAETTATVGVANNSLPTPPIVQPQGHAAQ